MKNYERILNRIDWWYRDFQYLMDVFGDVFDHLDLDLFSLSSQYVKFLSKDFEVTFQYDVSRSNMGRSLVDITLVNDENRTYRLSQIIQESNPSKSLNKIVRDGSLNKIPPLETYLKLFETYMLDYTNN